MTYIGTRSQRGIALMLVLVLLIVVTTATVGLARLATTERLARELDRKRRVADDLLAAAEAPIRHWLENESGKVVLPPDAPSAEQVILHDLWTRSNTTWEIRITAYDQLGMIHPSVLRRGSPLRLAVPDSVLAHLERYTDWPDDLNGLDQFTSDRWWHDGLRVYPVPFASEVVMFQSPPDRHDASDSVLNAWSSEQSQLPIRGETEPPALGSWLATHQGGPNQPTRLNVNTAPMALLEAALRATGRGGLDAIGGARERATPAASPPPAPRQAHDHGRTIRFSATSTRWSFRIDLRIGTLQRAWWMTYIRHDGEWRLVQRRLIHD